MDFYTVGTRGFFLACDEEVRRRQADTSSARSWRHERRSFSRGSLFKPTWPKQETAHEKPLVPRVGFEYRQAITGYRFISSNRVGRLGEGAGLYLRDTFHFNIMSDLCSSNYALFNSVFVEIENPHGTVCRPPSANLHEFLDSFHKLLDRVTRDNKMC